MTIWKTAIRARQTADVLNMSILILLEDSYDFITCCVRPSRLSKEPIIGGLFSAIGCELSVICHLPAYTCFDHLSCHEVLALLGASSHMLSFMLLYRTVSPDGFLVYLVPHAVLYCTYLASVIANYLFVSLGLRQKTSKNGQA